MTNQYPAGRDFLAARFLCRMTQVQLAELAGVSVPSIDRIEGDAAGVKEETKLAVYRVLDARGVQFMGADDVLLKGDRAPTPARVGRLTGDRLKRARYALRWSPSTLAQRAKVSTESVHRMEGAADVTKAVVAETLYAVVCALERGRYRFGRVRSTDGLAIPRCKRCSLLHPKAEACPPPGGQAIVKMRRLI